jgi:ABC-type multidrug transport system fused ATPase/permease subunit
MWAAGTTIQSAVYGTRAAIVLHDRAFENLLRAPLAFFESTPTGRILARFSRDQDTIDTSLMGSVQMAAYQACQVAGSLLMIGATSPWFFLGLAPIMTLYAVVHSYFRPTSRELKRLDSISRSPLYAHFSESLTGLGTIRAYRQEEQFETGNRFRLDDQGRHYFALTCASRWLSMRLELLGALIVLVAAVTLTSSRLTIPAGIVGLALSYALMVTQSLQFLVRQSVEAENNINSVERSKFYTEQIDQEAPAHVPDVDDKIDSMNPNGADRRDANGFLDADMLLDQPPSHSSNAAAVVSSSFAPSPSWPFHGAISIRHLAFRYRPHLPLVIHDLSVNIRGGERVGIVGRTGAGQLYAQWVAACGGSVSPRSI